MVPKAPIDPALLQYCEVPRAFPSMPDDTATPDILADYIREVLRIDTRNTSVIAECYRMQRGLVDVVKRRE